MLFTISPQRSEITALVLPESSGIYFGNEMGFAHYRDYVHVSILFSVLNCLALVTLLWVKYSNLLVFIGFIGITLITN